MRIQNSELKSPEHPSGASRLLIISNRLPFTAEQQKGELKINPSSGGLVTGLSAYLEHVKGTSDGSEYIWIGWPGATIDEPHREQLKSISLERFSSYPVFLTKQEMDNFYYGFCNETIWPVFHYFPSVAVYEESYWQNYRRVNEVFADAVAEIMRPDDIVWVHDYQLMLLPALIRERVPGARIGFFLHIPFPGYELFRLLPRKWGNAILDGMLGADLIGFHTHDYTQYFLRSVLRLRGHEHNTGELILGDRVVKVDTFPMGIDYDKFSSATLLPEVLDERARVLSTIPGMKLMVSIDRLDYTKGVLNRLQGYLKFLEQNPQWHRKVALALVVIPSRTEVEQYSQTKKRIEELVSQINGRSGGIDWIPVLYQYRSLPFATLIAYYAESSVALVTPLRDGMNLVAKEYIATRGSASPHEAEESAETSTQSSKSGTQNSKGTGVLILSHMAGAAKELGEAIIINPNSREEIAEAMLEALEMPEDEQRHRNAIMQERLKRYNVITWASDFISELHAIGIVQERFKARVLSPALEDRMAADYRRSMTRLILLDYDGTLVPFSDRPESARPGDGVLDLLSGLAGDPANEVVLISGRDRHTLAEWFGHLNVGLVAEHGVWTRPLGEDWQTVRALNNSWKPSIMQMLELYVDRLPGAFTEEKDYSIAWHYRAADPDLGAIMSKELLDQLVNYTANSDVQVLQGNKVIEVKSAGVNKGSTGLQWLGRNQYDFILAIGDDWTDEHLFMVLPEWAYSIRVGLRQSYARFNVHSHDDVIQLLSRLVASEAEPESALARHQ